MYFNAIEAVADCSAGDINGCVESAADSSRFLGPYGSTFEIERCARYDCNRNIRSLHAFQQNIFSVLFFNRCVVSSIKRTATYQILNSTAMDIHLLIVVQIDSGRTERLVYECSIVDFNLLTGISENNTA